MHLAHTAHRALTQTPWCYTQARYNSDLRNMELEKVQGWFVLEHFLQLPSPSTPMYNSIKLKGDPVQKGVRHPKETPQKLWTNSQAVVTVTLIIVCAQHNQSKPDRKEKKIKCTLSVIIKYYTFLFLPSSLCVLLQIPRWQTAHSTSTADRASVAALIPVESKTKWAQENRK